MPCLATTINFEEYIDNMAEISNKQTRQPATRTARASSSKSTESNSRNGNVTQSAQSARVNGNQEERRTRQHLKSYTAPDSESDFRAFRQSSGNRHINSFSDNQRFNESRVNGNRARPGNGNFKRNDNNGNRRNFQNRSTQNGQQWSPSDASYNPGLQELRGSDWYREDQARYAAQQIANERNGTDADGNSTAPQRNNDKQRTNNQRGRQRRRPANQQQRNSNPQHATGNRNNESPNAGKPARTPNHKKHNHPSRSRPGNNNGITPTTPTTRSTESKPPSTPPSDAKTTKADATKTESPPVVKVDSTTATETQSSDAPAKEHNKARRAPWRTQKHGTRRKTTGPSAT